MLLVVPNLFRRPIEFSVLALVSLGSAGWLWGGRWWRAVVATLAVMAAWAMILTAQTQSRLQIASARNLYGWLRVTKDPDAGADRYFLLHNTTLHGEEDRRHPQREVMYYGRSSGLGQALAEKQLSAPSLSVGVIGLGTGAIARLLREEDSIAFYEINPQVEEFARQYFSYLATSHSRVVIGDGRIALEAEANSSFDVLVLDAFNGDAVPIHLLTAEAGEVYQRRLKPDGLLAIHISNSHVDLRRVAEGLAKSMNRSSKLVSSDDAEWALLVSGAAQSSADAIRWTDERSSLLPLIDWKGTK